MPSWVLLIMLLNTSQQVPMPSAQRCEGVRAMLAVDFQQRGYQPALLKCVPVMADGGK